MSETNNRETLGSRLGFIFLSAGCAIGLGNVWRFPYITGKYGGAAFVLLYIVFLLIFAMPIMTMEFAVGRASRRCVINAFTTLCPEKKGWTSYGWIAMAGNYILMMFYTTITGWMLAYTWYSAAGQLEGLSVAEIGARFDALLADPWTMTFWLALSVALGGIVCFIGLRSGVERVTKVMMAGLLTLMLVLAVRSMTLPGAGAGLSFYLKPDFAKVKAAGLGEAVYAALGQAFFTLSVGMGGMTIFGSYIGRDKSLTGEALIITGLDTFVAVTAGLIIFPACFAYGIEPNAGPGLIFVTLPNMFNQMPQGRLWSALFFLFMSFAALSTVIAVLENIIAGAIDEKGWGRKKSAVVNALAIFVLSIPCVLGFNVWSGFAPLGKGTIILDLEDFLVSNNILPLGSIVCLMFCTTRSGWGWDSFLKEVDTGNGLKFPSGLRNYFVYVVPFVMFLIFAFGYYEKFFK